MPADAIGEWNLAFGSSGGAPPPPHHPQPASPTGINKLIMRAIRREKEGGGERCLALGSGRAPAAATARGRGATR